MNKLGAISHETSKTPNDKVFFLIHPSVNITASTANDGYLCR